MIDRRTESLLLLASLLFLVVTFFIGSEIPSEFSILGRPVGQVEDSTAASRLKLINSALGEGPRVDFFEYTGGFENPFRNIRQARRSTGPADTSAQSPREKLSLKGILIKEKPLAILEDGMGETYIRGIGEKALEQTITAISDNSVTLRDRRGIYELTVEEN